MITFELSVLIGFRAGMCHWDFYSIPKPIKFPKQHHLGLVILEFRYNFLPISTNHSIMVELFLLPQLNSYGEVLIPSASQCDFIWK